MPLIRRLAIARDTALRLQRRDKSRRLKIQQALSIQSQDP